MPCYLVACASDRSDRDFRSALSGIGRYLELLPNVWAVQTQLACSDVMATLDQHVITGTPLSGLVVVQVGEGSRIAFRTVAVPGINNDLAALFRTDGDSGEADADRGGAH